MVFGDGVCAAESTAPAAWIEGELDGRPETVGALVPSRYASVVRLHAPPPTPDDWWSLYRELFGLVASVGARHTSTPGRAWFAIWEGHGFAGGTTKIAWRDPPADDEERRAREALRAQVRDESERRIAATSAALDRIPRFELPDRTYYIVEGPLSAVGTLRYPDVDDWRNPDLFWPDDRRWFAATDVDFWSLYVGGDPAFVDDLAREASTECEPVTSATRLETEI